MPRARKKVRSEEHGESSRARHSTRHHASSPPPPLSEEDDVPIPEESAEAVSSSPEDSNTADHMEEGGDEFDFDSYRFRNRDRQLEFETYWYHRPVLCERGIRLSHFPTLQENFTHRGWIQAMTFRASADPMIVREFFANVKVHAPDAGEKQLLVKVRGHRFRLKASTIAAFLELASIEHPGYPYSEDAFPSRDTLAAALSDGSHRTWGVVAQFPKRHLSPLYRVLHELSCSQIFPLVHDDSVSLERAALLYAIATGVTIDLAGVIFDTIIQRATHLLARSVLPFGGLLTSIMEQFEVIVEDTGRTVHPSTMISESTGARRTAQLRFRDPPAPVRHSSSSTAGPSTPSASAPPRQPPLFRQRDVFQHLDTRVRHMEEEIHAIRDRVDGLALGQAATHRLLESQGATLDSILAALRALPPPPPPPADSFERPPSP